MNFFSGSNVANLGIHDKPFTSLSVGALDALGFAIAPDFGMQRRKDHGGAGSGFRGFGDASGPFCFDGCANDGSFLVW